MGGAKRVVFAFTTLGKAGKTVALPQGPNTIPPSGQNFVRISLMPDIPNKPVFRRVKNVVQRNGQLNNA